MDQSDHTNPTHALAQRMRICNRRGLHARASARFVRLTEQFDADISVTHNEVTVGGTSIMGLMMLAAGPGSHILVRATGKQAREALDALSDLIDCGFDEDSEAAGDE
ncbi:MAG: HPr family phosphocarrier protein [Hyphomicrobiaceae bacterium]|nr:HPr family phosphocarrier protein [Hyphomicrobiaceae bacterium]MCC0023981.1 HPr family phosphocarrier protein [Hyphomicrobiaceae bacterium]